MDDGEERLSVAGADPARASTRGEGRHASPTASAECLGRVQTHDVASSLSVLPDVESARAQARATNAHAPLHLERCRVLDAAQRGAETVHAVIKRLVACTHERSPCAATGVRGLGAARRGAAKVPRF